MTGQANCFVPLVLVALTACAVILVDMFTPLARSRKVAARVALLGTVLALFALLLDLAFGCFHGAAFTFHGMLAYDQVSTFLSVLFVLGTLSVILFSVRSEEIAGYRHGEYYALLLGALFGALLLANANNLVLFMLALETLSLCSYVLAGYLRHERNSAEASLKYLIYGAVISGVLLFGMSYLYGLTGTLELSEASKRLAEGAASGAISPPVLYFVFALIIAGLGFKTALVPFHFWCPDVYQGAPTPITAFLSVVSKAAGFGAMLRILLPFYGAYAETAPTATGTFAQTGILLLFGVLALVTMTYGNLAALRQTNIKRLMAYSSIAHAGYLLMPLTVGDPQAVEAMLFYFLIYVFMNLGVFWIIIVLGNRTGSAEIAAFRGVAHKAPYLFVPLFIFLIALTGLPPTAGFVGKFMLFKVVVGAGIAHMDAGQFTPAAACYLLLALAGVLNSAISLFYYMKIVRIMAFERPEDEQPLHFVGLDRAYALAFAVPTLLLLYFPPVLGLIQAAGR